ncbi:DUF1353 domain-containing protein [Nocardia crassostreae]|uniref:DUF1353 domain-containing protein n=1 Tax=Nocardia crassostreae TaxID=53428 RepID=UPI00082F3D6C|nr:DUF1353 domain-containing protein [Nocardia crassostreae]
MGFVGGGLVVEEVDGEYWLLREPLIYRADVQEFAIPSGFRTDFASVPRVLVWLIPRYGVYTRAAILHDFLIRSAAVSKADADGIFRRAMREAGVSVPRRWMMWAAVRIASRLAGIKPGEFLLFLMIAVLSVLFLTIPVLVILLALLVFWFVELAFWACSRMTQRTERPAPGPELKAD